MIIFLTAREHEIAHAQVPPAAEAVGLQVQVISYPDFFSRNRLPEATYVFTDHDRLSPELLRRAARLFAQARDRGFRVLNDPARIRSRWGLLRHLWLQGYNSFNAYRAEEGARPARWPVFLRTEGGHDSPARRLLQSWEEVEQAIAYTVERGTPLANLLIVEFAGEPVRPGLWRKLSSFRIGERSVPYPGVHDDHWIAKDGKRGIAPPELYEEELRIVREDPYREPMQRAFELAGIDYGRSDFNLVAGRIELYEINLNPRVDFPPEPIEIRRQAWDTFRRNYLEALKAIDTGG